jgi:hypothetical protein
LIDELDGKDGFLGLYAEEPVLSGDSRFLREAGIRFGRVTTSQVADEDLPAAVHQRVDLPRLRFDRLTLPFELQFLPAGKSYVEAEIKLLFTTPDVHSVQLAPPDSPPLEPHVRLAITAVGQGELRWLITSTRADLGLTVGGSQVRAVVESPLDADTLVGTIDARAKVVSRSTRRLASKEISLKAPQSFVLGVAKGTFAFCGD